MATRKSGSKVKARHPAKATTKRKTTTTTKKMPARAKPTRAKKSTTKKPAARRGTARGKSKTMTLDQVNEMQGGWIGPADERGAPLDL